MSKDFASKPRLSLSKTQIQEGVGAELFSLCQEITADGRLTKDEIIALRLWLRDNKDAQLPGIGFLSETLNRIIADGRVTRDEQRELLEAIEKILPPDERQTAKAARKAVERKRKADERAARDQQRELELTREQRRRPEDEFDFMVAGVHVEGRHRIVNDCLERGDRVRIVPEPDNAYDDCAVAVTLLDGRMIGHVPRTDSKDVTGCIRRGGYYVATVKKILSGGRVPIPVVVLQFYRPDQMDEIADLSPDVCPIAPSSQTPKRGLPKPRKPWWKFW